MPLPIPAPSRRALRWLFPLASLALATVPARAGLANTAWPKFRGDAANTGRGDGSGAQGILRWKAPGGGYVASPVIGPDGTVYIAAYTLDAFDGVTGAMKWQSQFPDGADYVKATAAVGTDGTLVLLGQEGSIYKADMVSGQVMRVNKLLTNFRSSAALGQDGTIYAGGSDGLYALDGATGIPKWSFLTDGGVENCPAIGADGTVYFGDDGGTVYAVNPQTHHEIWSSTATGTDPIYSSPALGDDGAVYVGSENGNVYALNGTNGHVLWTFPTGGAVESSPAVGKNGTVYVGSFDNNVYAIHPDTGRQVWKFTAGDLVKSSPALASDGAVYVCSQDGKLYALDGATGAKQWDYALLPYGEITDSPAVGADGTVYAAASSGPLTAIRALGFIATDAAAVLRIAGGVSKAPGDITRLDVQTGAPSTGRLDILDAVRLARLAAGTEPS